MEEDMKREVSKDQDRCYDVGQVDDPKEDTKQHEACFHACHALHDEVRVRSAASCCVKPLHG